jgi:cobalamin biosynthesis protein CobD/CbiB
MEVTIDQDVIALAVKEAVEGGISSGVGSWETRRALDEAVQRAVEKLGLVELVSARIESELEEHRDEVVAQAVAGIMPGLEQAMQTAMRVVAQSMMYGLLTGKPSSYNVEETQKWNEAGLLIAGDEKSPVKLRNMAGEVVGEVPA